MKTANQQESIKTLITDRRQLIEEQKMMENEMEEVVRDRHLSLEKAGFIQKRLTQVREELNKERDELRNKIDELSREKDELSRKNDELSNEKDEPNDEKDELNKERDELSRKTEELSKERDELRNKINELSREKDELSRKNDELNNEKDELSRKTEELSKERDRLSEDKHELRQEKDKLNKEKKDLSTEKEELKKEREKLRVLTDQAEKRCRERDALKNFYDALMKFDNFPVRDLCPVSLRPKCQHCAKHEKSYKGHCYYIYPYDIGYANWDRSRQLCKTEGGDLVVIDDLEEQEFINNHTQKYDSDNHGYWIGLHHFRHNWSWVDGRRNFLEFWIEGIPRSSGAALHMPRQKATESWRAEDKMEASKFICERLEISWPFG
ncbi:C-type lectin domain family 4 member G-like [Poecilia reticulata]|uniref:C-type lectin domain family 4 member G-like n=1 Tax=Poecilia reticulata TaxID=8081 RepID=UPI0004A4B409|nr:PREDICTED: C-type lectin domain family 4 member G-like [Poecilia reticulata]